MPIPPYFSTEKTGVLPLRRFEQVVGLTDSVNQFSHLSFPMFYLHCKCQGFAEQVPAREPFSGKRAELYENDGRVHGERTGLASGNVLECSTRTI